MDHTFYLIYIIFEFLIDLFKFREEEPRQNTILHRNIILNILT